MLFCLCVGLFVCLFSYLSVFSGFFSRLCVCVFVFIVFVFACPFFLSFFCLFVCLSIYLYVCLAHRFPVCWDASGETAHTTETAVGSKSSTADHHVQEPRNRLSFVYPLEGVLVKQAT